MRRIGHTHCLRMRGPKTRERILHVARNINVRDPTSPFGSITRGIVSQTWHLSHKQRAISLYAPHAQRLILVREAV